MASLTEIIEFPYGKFPREQVMLEMAKDLLYYGENFHYFMTFQVCYEVGIEESFKVWKKAIDIMANSF